MSEQNRGMGEEMWVPAFLKDNEGEKKGQTGIFSKWECMSTVPLVALGKLCPSLLSFMSEYSEAW